MNAMGCVNVSACINTDGKIDIDGDYDDLSYGFKVLVNCMIGGTSDNAPDAQLELKLCLDALLDIKAKSGLHGIYNDVDENNEEDGLGVQHERPVQVGDIFHILNLTLCHATNGAFGKKEKGNHREIHHGQTIQTFYDLHKLDPEHLKHGTQAELKTILFLFVFFLLYLLTFDLSLPSLLPFPLPSSLHSLTQPNECR